MHTLHDLTCKFCKVVGPLGLAFKNNSHITLSFCTCYTSNLTIPMIMILMILLTNIVHKVKCLIITYYTCVYHNMSSYSKL